MASDVLVGDLGSKTWGDRSEDAFDRVQRELLAAAQRVRGRIEAHLEELRRTDPSKAEDFWERLTPVWKDKYCDRAGEHIAKWREFMPHLDGFAQAYEIGVGPGSLFRLLAELKGVRMWGCDVDPERSVVFRELRKELGISGRVDNHPVQRRTPVPIPEGTEALIAFYTTFSRKFSVQDWEWLLDFCRERLVGEKWILMLPNPKSFGREGVAEFFRRKADFPLLDAKAPEDSQLWHNRAFCRFSLD